VEGETWRLNRLQLQGQSVVVIENRDRYTLSFNEEQRIGARSDCNQCGGTYTLNNGAFTVGPLACTKAYCGDLSLDASYSAILSEARTLQMENDTLVVGSNRGTLWYTR